MLVALATIVSAPAIWSIPTMSFLPTPAPNLFLDNLSTLPWDRARSLSILDALGTGICETAMQGYTCDTSNYDQFRCAGDNYSYCICAGGANGLGQDGVWLNTAWGPGCYACCARLRNRRRNDISLMQLFVDNQARGTIFDGTCDGDGSGGTGQGIDEIMATLTLTVVVVQSSASERGTRVRKYL